MAQPNRAGTEQTAPQLYLVTPPIDDAQAFAAPLRAALGAAGVAAVLLRLAPAGERALIERVKTLAAVVQPTGAALVLDGHADLVARAGADGAHLTGIAAFTDAVETLKPARIAGCGGLASRHDAMLAGERGADYVMFGDSGGDGHRLPFNTVLERLEWWSALFEIPCVGFAANLDEAAALATAGAEFVAVGQGVWDHPRGAATALADVVRRIGASEPAA
jgi:thiamine-phosphate pyrophosphorylase